MDYLSRAQKVFETEIAELVRLQHRLGEDFEAAVRTLRFTVDSGGKIIVVGVGKCSHIGEKIAATLTSTGSPSIFLNSQNALHGDLGIVADRDAVLALSYSGETEEMLTLLSALRRFTVDIIAVTGNRMSTLARESDIVIELGVEKEACPLELAPTSSTTAMLVLGDALAMVLLEASGFKPEDFARYHPGGSLGRKLLSRACDMMRPLAIVAAATPGDPVADALDAMTRCRGGAAVVVNDDDTLAGIFTHGDFVRAFREHGAAITGMRVSQLMTANPVTTSVDKLAVEVLRILKEHRIDDIVVLGADGKPAGLIDVQDLSRLGML